MCSHRISTGAPGHRMPDMERVDKRRTDSRVVVCLAMRGATAERSGRPTAKRCASLASVDPVSNDERRLFAAPALSGQFDGIELSLLDPDDEDDRTVLVLAEHPELRSAIESGRDKIHHHHGRVVNPQLHLAMHEIVANQLLVNEPPEMWDTAKRLVDAGYERHEVLHMLASVVSADVYSALHDNQSKNPAQTRAALAALPGSWERQREEIPAERHANRAERRATERKHPR